MFQGTDSKVVWIELAKAILVGIAILLLTTFAWEILLAVNSRVLTSMPIAGLGAILYGIFLWLLLRPNWITRPLSFPSKLTRSDWKIVFTGLLGCIALMFFLAAIWPYKLVAPQRPALVTFQLQLSFAIVGPGLAALVEEIAFRGVVQPRLESALGVSLGILTCSFLFMLAHVANAEFSIQAPFYFVTSIYFGIVAWRTNSLCVPIVGHVALNVLGNSVALYAGPIDSGNWDTSIAWVTGIVSAALLVVFAWLLWRDHLLQEA